MELRLWNDLLWDEQLIARCPEHRVKLDVLDSDNDLVEQLGTPIRYAPHGGFMCPVDRKGFALPGEDYNQLRRHFKVTLEAKDWKDAKIVSIDGYQVPIARVRTEEDPDYWVEARINDTKQGKQLVVYAGKRGERDKAQIFIDTENDKISFDQNNIHPNDVFVRLTGEFASGKKSTLESDAV
jgi:hypothetical protein